ncbi:MAG: PSD1 and planctomycete cytochrome C domain-containing protein [Bryobacteraceae bacterium]|nr:PSD1 and planctomycete cytochrome C domain-containing protein [Bryobacteraceae bacterium]
MVRPGCAVFLLPVLCAAAGDDLFEKKIRPVLAEKCYGCHSSKSKAPMGGLAADTRDGLRKVIVPGDPGGSRLLTALRYTDPHLKMPPAGKLPEGVIADFERWIAEGAADPRTGAAAAAAASKPDLERGREWWAFRPVREYPAPKAGPWIRRKVDAFVLKALEDKGLAPSPEADPRVLIRRVSLDLIGLPPSFEETESFAADPSYEHLIERLLASPRYGERWGRNWLDVARWAEDNPTGEATNPPYPYSWRYRDWVIEAVNKDLPYNEFVKRQFAADLLPGLERSEMRALGYLGTGPVYHKDNRLSKEVIETLASDDWDERVDAVSRGLLGLTVACARCHDHKFDPITAKDYYGLAGVFASTWQVKRPLEAMEPEAEARLMWVLDRHHHLNAASKLLSGSENIAPEIVKRRERVLAELAKLKEEAAELEKRELVHAVSDAGIWIDGADPIVTWLDIRPGKPRDLPVFLRGNVATPGETAPRRFLTVLSKGEPRPFRMGSGRLELASSIVEEAAPLAARVWVNRVWGWHFGRHIVGTPSDFGTQGDKPTHPELLDDLAARFIANGWSLKWLHREILLSAAYRQSSAPNPRAALADPTNSLLWRMNPRRLDFEAWRDAILTVSGSLDVAASGPSVNLDDKANRRRTVYAEVSRRRPNPLLRLYDFGDVNQHVPSREVTTTPLQQLFVFNSDFFHQQAEALNQRAGGETGAGRVRTLYRLALARDPKPKEIELGLSFVAKRSWAEYAQVLLGTNEFIFVR